MAWIVAAVAATAPAACGGGDDRPQPDAAPAPEARDRSVRDCREAGIDERGGRQGTCAVGEVVRTVVDRDRPLVLDGLVEMRLGEVTTGQVAGGEAVAITIRVRNRGPRPFRWPSSPGRVALYAGERLVAQDRRRADRARRALGIEAPPSARVAPGERATIAAAWRLAPRQVRALGSRGSAVIVVPPHEEAPSVPAAYRIGVLRLWK